MTRQKNILSVVVVTLTAICIGIVTARPVGFSYAKFSGPVSGPEKEIYIKDAHGHSHIDYIAKPDYSFSYGVDDPKSKVLQNRKETRHGDAVKGEYSVVDPDGTLRVVKYTADKINGFQAEVITDGKSEIHGHDVAHPQHQHQQQHNHHHHHHHQQHPAHHQINYNQQDGPQVSYGTHQQHPDYHQQQQQQHQEQQPYANDDDEDEDDGDNNESGEASGETEEDY